MQRARALILAVEYVLVLAALWLGVADWMTANVTGGPFSNAGSEMAHMSAKLGAMYVYPNVLGFGACALWFGRERSFAPLARYLFPSALAAFLTLVLAVAGTYLMLWVLYLIWPRPQAVTLLILSVPAVLPGLITGQLLRWPRVESVEPLHAEPHAVRLSSRSLGERASP